MFMILENYVFQRSKTLVWLSIAACTAVFSPAILCRIFMSLNFQSPRCGIGSLVPLMVAPMCVMLRLMRYVAWPYVSSAECFCFILRK